MTSLLVAVCTYRRPDQLLVLLDSLAAQDLQAVPDVDVRLLVVDNSPDLEARAAVQQFAERSGMPVQYAPHGAGNIASGRNQALALVPEDVDLVALVDDDEVADPDWLASLVLAQRRTGADMVTGPVLAAYPASAPGWLRSDLFYSVTGPAEGAYVDEAVTGNALLRRSTVRDLQLSFDTSLGASGGEDQLFTRTARARGARLWFEPTAVVRESVPLPRLSLRYLVRREYRKGNTLGLLDRSRPGWPDGRPLRRLASAGYWAVTGSAAAVTAAVRRDRQAAAAGLLRVARSLGMVSGLCGTTFQHYGVHAPARRTDVLALVLPEDPAYQQAGHSQYLGSFVDHFVSRGTRVVVVVTEGRLSFLVRRKGSVVYRVPGVVDIAGWQVAVRPRLIVRWLAWTAFRAAPRRLQGAVDRVRTSARSGRNVDHSLGRPLDGPQSAQVLRTLARERPSVVLFSSPFSIPQALQLPESVRATGLICLDVVSQRAADMRSNGYRVTPPDFDEEQERAAMEGMSVVVAIQWDDAKAFRAMAPAGTSVVVCPVAVEQAAGPRSVEPDRCLFVGSGSLHNVDGLRWFLDQCWPAVRASRPSAELRVVGTVCARIGPVPPGVVLCGEVAELAPHYASASVVVVPLRTGSGLKVKIVEALCHGAAVVTTGIGAQGLSGLGPAPFVIADDAAAFAAAVAQVLTDSALRERLEAAATRTAPVFSPARAFAELDGQLVERGALADRGPTTLAG
jgi:hypothetical protein